MLKILFSFTLTFIIFFSPFAFGTVHLGPITALLCSILFLFFLYILRSIKNGAIEYRRNVLNVFFFCFVAYAALQLCFHITKYPYRTFLGLKISLCYFALFLAVVNSIRKKDEIRAIVFKITLAGFFASLLGIFQKLLGSTKIYWIREVPHPRFFGPFINENHFAAYISVIAFVTLGSIFADIYGKMKPRYNNSSRGAFLSLLDTLLNQKMLFKSLAFIIMVIALFLSKSRSGILFFGAALIFFVLSLLFKKNIKKTIGFILLGFFVIYLSLNWVGVGKSLEELRTVFYLPDHVGRVAAYEDAKNMFASYPVFGIGLGAFSNIFPMYRTGFELLFHLHLHNDVFQLLVELGAMGFILIVLPFAVFLLRLFLETGKMDNAYKYYISLGIIAAFVYLGLHSLVDFSMRLNAVSTLFIILLSLAPLVIYLRQSREGEKIDMDVKRVIIIKNKEVKTFSYALSTVVFLFLLFIISKPFIAHMLVRNTNSISTFKKAIRLDPKNDTLYYRFYHFILRQYQNGLINKDTVYRSAREAIDKAINLNPYNNSYLMAKGWLEFWQKDYENADFLFKEAALREPDNQRVQLTYAYALFRRGLDETDEKKKKVLLNKGLIYYEKARFLSKHVFLKSVIKNSLVYNTLKAQLKEEGIVVE